MSKEIFLNIIKEKVEEITKLKEEAEQEIKFYSDFDGKYPEELEQAQKKLTYANSVLNELKKIVMLPIYSRIQNMSNEELEEDRGKEIKFYESEIAKKEQSIKTYQEEIRSLENKINQIIWSYGYTLEPKEKTQKVFEDLKGKIKALKEEIKLAEEIIQSDTRTKEKLQEMSYEELKQRIISLMELSDLKTAYENKMSSKTDEIITSIADKPEIANQLLNDITQYETYRDTVNFAEIENDNTYLEYSCPSFVEKLLKGTEVARKNENGKIVVWTLKDIVIINKNISDMIKEGEIISNRIMTLQNTIVNMDKIYQEISNGNINNINKEQIYEVINTIYNDDYSKFSFDSQLLPELSSKLEQYDELSTKTFKSNDIKNKMNTIEKEIKTLIDKIFYGMFLKACDEIKWFKNTITYNLPTGVLPLDNKDISKYNLSYESINNMPSLLNFFTKYLTTIKITLVKHLFKLHQECDRTSIKLNEKNTNKKYDVESSFEKIQKNIQNIMGSEFELEDAYISQLGKDLREKRYEKGKINVEIQAEIDQYKELGTVMSDFNLSDLMDLKNELEIYLDSNEINSKKRK